MQGGLSHRWAAGNGAREISETAQRNDKQQTAVDSSSQDLAK